MQARRLDWQGWGVVAWALLPLLAPLVIAQAPLNERVLVVYNAEMPQSKQIAAYYMSKRAIPKGTGARSTFRRPTSSIRMSSTPV
jgi:hypothetical protein